MKFLLKVLVLGLLIVVSKLAKNQTIAMERPHHNVKSTNSIFFNSEQASVLPAGHSAASVKM